MLKWLNIKINLFMLNREYLCIQKVTKSTFELRMKAIKLNHQFLSRIKKLEKMGVKKPKVYIIQSNQNAI